MPEIVLMHAARELARRTLDGGEVRIGRDDSNEIVIADPRVSRNHARIYREGSAYILEDRESTHGTFLGKTRIHERRLKDGDIIRIGDHYLAFISQEGAAVIPMGEPAPRSDEYDTWAEFQTMLMQPGTGQESARRLKALFEMSLELETATDFKDLLRRLMAKAIAIMGAERGFLMLRDPDSRELSVHVALDEKGSIAGLDAESISKSLMQQVISTSKPLLIKNALSGEWGSESVFANRIHSALCVPLISREEVTGVIYVDHRTRVSAFNEADLAFFTTFSVQAKAAIDASRAYWELVNSLFAVSDDFVVVCDSNGVITQANSGAAKLTGVAALQLAGRGLAELMASSDAKRVAELRRQAMDQGVFSGVELSLSMGSSRKDIPLSISGFALRDRSGKPISFCVIGRDLSVTKSLIEQLTAANIQLRELNDMKSQFVGMISHELKTPLSVVVGYAEMMLEDKEEVPSLRQRDYLTRILRSGDRLISLIMELLELTRIETGKIELRISRIDIRGMLAEIADAFSLQAREKGVVIIADVPRDLPPLEGDAGMVRRALENFISNGIKYNRSGGKLTIAAAQKGGDCVLSFSDEGIGISEDDQKKIFERFFRSESVHGIPGTGLGLSIVKAIISRHGGRIQVESKLEKGTTFRVTLPMTGRPEAA